MFCQLHPAKTGQRSQLCQNKHKQCTVHLETMQSSFSYVEFLYWYACLSFLRRSLKRTIPPIEAFLLGIESLKEGIPYIHINLDAEKHAERDYGGETVHADILAMASTLVAMASNQRAERQLRAKNAKTLSNTWSLLLLLLPDFTHSPQCLAVSWVLWDCIL